MYMFCGAAVMAMGIHLIDVAAIHPAPRAIPDTTTYLQHMEEAAQMHSEHRWRPRNTRNKTIMS